MTLPDELERLAALHASGALSDDEFAAAKAALLGGGASGPQRTPSADDIPVSRQHLDELRRANAVAELDRAWSMERDELVMTGSVRSVDGHAAYPYRYRPSRTGSVISGIAITLAGCFFTAASLEMTASFGPSGMRRAMGGGMGSVFDLFPLFGILVIVFGLWTSYQSFTMADTYESAERNYRRRRAALLAGRDDPGPSAAPEAGESGMDEDGGDSSEADGGGDGIFFG